jgi:hypothetical protein
MHSLWHYQHPQSECTFATIQEPTLTHRRHPKSTIYFRVHAWCYIFCGFGQTCNNMYLSFLWLTGRNINGWQVLYIFPSLCLDDLKIFCV